jgi:hypothetical protein
MLWNVSVGVRLTIDYDDIEADTEEEARQIAEERAEEDVYYNNADWGGTTIYCAWPNEEEEDVSNN